MKQQKKQIHKCSKKQRKTAKTAISCLMLLLLYGCAYQDVQNPAVTVLSDGDDMQEIGSSQASGESPAEDGEALCTDTDGGRAHPSHKTETLTVYVCGAVKKPGVYELAEGSRVYEALAMAGGLTMEAAPTAVNQAGLLSDGQMIEIPTEEEAQAKANEEKARTDGLVNINTADLEELKTLPGIGESKARSIIAYREKNGAFGAIEDIKKIEGIKDGIFAKLEGCIKVD